VTAEALELFEATHERGRQEETVRLEVGIAYVHLGIMHGILGEPTQAKELLRKAIAVFEGLASDFPENPDYQAELAAAHVPLGEILAGEGRSEEAADVFRSAVRIFDRAMQRHGTARVASHYAELLATCVDERFRDPIRAVEVAKRGLDLAPQAGNLRQVLGVAYYRKGCWKDCIAALERSMQLRSAGDPFDWFFLAMAHGQLGDRARARHWYDKALAALHPDTRADEPLGRARDEAKTVLEHSGPPSPKPKE
jgi:tetratricopeptide (TPR) repeat protein